MTQATYPLWHRSLSYCQLSGCVTSVLTCRQAQPGLLHQLLLGLCWHTCPGIRAREELSVRLYKALGYRLPVEHARKQSGV